VGYSSPTTTARYAYDALDRRIAKTVDGVVEAHVHDGTDLEDTTTHNAALTFRAGALIKRWLFGPQVDEPLAFEAHAGTTAPGSGAVTALFANRLGSIVTAVALSTGTVSAAYDYDAFGARSQTGTLEQPYGFTGREHDAESGLIHFRARAYDPVAGRFLQEDPVGFLGGDLNLYAYVRNQPETFTDPSGLTGVEIRRLIRANEVIGHTAVGRHAPALLNAAGSIARALQASGNYMSGSVRTTRLVSRPNRPNQATNRNNTRNEASQEIYYLVSTVDFSIQKIGLRAQGQTRYSNACLKRENVRLIEVHKLTSIGWGSRALGLLIEEVHTEAYRQLNGGREPPRNRNFPC
jgi:RHS repeat-associated protein